MTVPGQSSDAKTNNFGAQIFHVWAAAGESGADGRGTFNSVDANQQHPRVYQYIASQKNFKAAAVSGGNASVKPPVAEVDSYITKSTYPNWSPGYPLGLDGPLAYGVGTKQQFWKWHNPLFAFAKTRADQLPPGHAVLIVPVGYGGTTGVWASPRWQSGGDLRTRALVLMADALALAKAINPNSFAEGIMWDFNVNDAFQATDPQAANLATFQTFTGDAATGILPVLRTATGWSEAAIIVNTAPPECLAFSVPVTDTGRALRNRNLMASTARAFLALAAPASGFHQLVWGWAPGLSGGVSTDAGDHFHLTRLGNIAKAVVDLAQYARVLQPPRVTIDWSGTSGADAAYLSIIIGATDVSVNAVPVIKVWPSGDGKALSASSITTADDIMQVTIDAADPALDAVYVVDMAPAWTSAGLWQMTVCAQAGSSCVVAGKGYGQTGIALYANEATGDYSLYQNDATSRTLIATASRTPASGTWWRLTRAVNGDLVAKYSADGTDGSWTTLLTGNSTAYTTGGLAVAQLGGTAAGTMYFPAVRLSRLEVYP